MPRQLRPKIRRSAGRLAAGALGLALSTAGQSSETPPLARPLDDERLEAKKEGQYVTGFPALAFNPDDGFIYGAVMFHFRNGEREDPRFVYTPYLQKTEFVAVQSTKGMSHYLIEADMPRLGASPYRLETELGLRDDISAQYYGRGEATLDDLRYPEGHPSQNESSGDYAKYEEELNEKLADGSTYARYHHYKKRKWEFSLSLSRPIATPTLRLAAGIAAAGVEVDDYTGETVDATQDGEETEAKSRSTRLRRDEKTTGVTGYNGGQLRFLTAGLTYDNLDFEPDPRYGILAELETKISRKSFGSSFNFANHTATTKGFASPAKRLTLAAQGRYHWTEGTTPFFQLPSLGGRTLLKGYRARRFVGTAAAQVNGEARFRFPPHRAGGQTFEYAPIVFVDSGRVFDERFTLRGDGWHTGAGGGLRFIWNQATVIGAEYAFQGEERALYVNIDHPF